MARNFRNGAKYLPRVLVQQLGPLTFLVEMRDGVISRRHMDHLKSLQESTTQSSAQAEPDPNEVRSRRCLLTIHG